MIKVTISKSPFDPNNLLVSFIKRVYEEMIASEQASITAEITLPDNVRIVRLRVEPLPERKGR